MAVRLDRAWIAAGQVLTRLKGTMGVFELADADHQTLFIGYAGGRSQYGLKGDVGSALKQFPEADFVRFEVTTAYHTRYRELLMAHVSDHGQLPKLNPHINLGRMSPA